MKVEDPDNGMKTTVFFMTLGAIAMAFVLLYVAVDYSGDACIESVVILAKDYVPAKSRSSEKYIIGFNFRERFESIAVDRTTYAFAKLGESITLKLRPGHLTGTILSAEVAK